MTHRCSQRSRSSLQPTNVRSNDYWCITKKNYIIINSLINRPSITNLQLEQCLERAALTYDIIKWHELDVVAEYNVNIIRVQAAETFLDTGSDTSGRIVELSHIVPIAADLGGDIVARARELVDEGV